MMNCAETAALLQSWDKILVLCHASPDGDTLGSAGGLVRGLRSLGKQAALTCADPIPEKFKYVTEGLEEGDFTPDHVMSVDVADLSLLGGLREAYENRIELAIDHHGTHRSFAKACWIEGGSAAAAEMIWLLLKELGVVPDRAMANCIYTGVTTDTGCFRYRNTTPRTHRIAAEAMEAGADTGEIDRVMFECKSSAQVEAERIVLDSMELFCDGKCAMVRVPQSVYGKTGASESDLEGVAAVPRQIKGVLLGVTLKEKESGEIKVSVRTNPEADAAALCSRFGGGGHKGAAGCSFPGLSMEEAAEKMKEACAAYLKELETVKA